jgi:hypothetical protein
MAATWLDEANAHVRSDLIPVSIADFPPRSG